MDLMQGFSLEGKNLLPLALRFKNYAGATVEDGRGSDNPINTLDEGLLIDIYRSITGESEKDICELAVREVTLDNIRILVHLTLEYANELKKKSDAEAMQALKEMSALTQGGSPMKKHKKSKLTNLPDQPFWNQSGMKTFIDTFASCVGENGQEEFFKQIEGKPEKLNAAKQLTEEYEKRSKECLSRVDEVKQLPVEDTIWLLDEICEFQDESGERLTSLIVQDKQNLVIGTLTRKKKDQTLAQQCHNLITVCALYPMEGVPRRPRSVTCKEPSFAERAAGLDLRDLGIRYMYAGITASDTSDYIRMRQCSVCVRRGSKALFKKCSSCQSVLYCSKVCQKKDWSMDGDMAPHSHKLWCKKMKYYMSKTEELARFPFTFAKETSSENFDALQYRQFLEKEGVYNSGFWRREARVPGLHENCQCCVPFGDISNCDDGIVLPVESTLLSEPPDNGTVQNVSDWNLYYQYRGLRMDSPIAILLQWPLTVYFIVKYCLPNDYSEWWDRLDSSTLVIDIVGVEKEVEMLDIFKELEFLFPDVSIDMVMYGAEISAKVNDKIYENGRVKIKVKQGLYHRKAEPDRKPDLVIGFNAGLGAYGSWSQTLVKLRTDKTPAYFTDYCQYSCECARKAVQTLGIGTVPEPIINPFRSPVRKLSSENDMPWFSNGFIIHLVYP